MKIRGNIVQLLTVLAPTTVYGQDRPKPSLRRESEIFNDELKQKHDHYNHAKSRSHQRATSSTEEEALQERHYHYDHAKRSNHRAPVEAVPGSELQLKHAHYNHAKSLSHQRATAETLQQKHDHYNHAKSRSHHRATSETLQERHEHYNHAKSRSHRDPSSASEETLQERHDHYKHAKSRSHHRATSETLQQKHDHYNHAKSRSHQSPTTSEETLQERHDHYNHAKSRSHDRAASSEEETLQQRHDHYNHAKGQSHHQPGHHQPRQQHTLHYNHEVDGTFSAPMAPIGKIIGGTNAQRDDFPFFVQGSQCGASLIAKDLVLSAAHCAGLMGNSLLVNAFRSGEQDEKTELIEVEANGEYLHDNWDSSNYNYDIMLIKLKSEVTNPAIQVIPLAGADYAFANSQTLTVMGFGDTTGNRDYSDELLKVDVNHIPYETCNSAASYDGRIVQNSMFCAGIYPAGGKDSCQGDSGGPIIDANGVQVGVVSWGYGCALANLPGVYASVPGALDWIRSKACELSTGAASWACGPAGPNPVPSPPAPVPSPPAPAPPVPSPAPPTPSNVEFYLDVQYDTWYWETRALLVNTAGGSTIVDLPFNQSLQEFAIVSTKIPLAEGSQYELTLSDSYGDGIHDGFAKVYAVGADFTTDLAYIDGNNFAYDASKTFTVPTNLGRATGNGGCVDTGKQFKVNDEVGIQGCAWLEQNKPRFDYLCQFTDVGFACPKTCDTCHWL